jgi:hypothetical protein
MRGSMTIEDPIDMEFKTGWVPFDGWYTKNACRDPFAFIGYMKIFFGGAPWGELPRLPIRIARLSVMSADPENTYGHRSWSGPPYNTWINGGEFTVELRNPKSEFEDNPYPLEVLIVSNNGVRWITLPPPPPTPKPPQDGGGLTGWKAKYLVWKASHCWKHINEWDRIHALWVLWKVDPGPEREFLRHWLVDVTGLQQTDALSLFDEGTGQELARMKPGVDGRATATALVAPSVRNRAAGVVVGLNGKFMSRADWDRARAGVAPPRAEPATNVAVRQILFRKEGTLRLPRAAESVRLDNEGGVPVLHVTDRRGVSVISLAPGESPTLLRRLERDSRGNSRTALLRGRTTKLVDAQIVSFDAADAALKLGAFKAPGVERIGRAPIRGLRHAVWMKKATGYEIIDLREPARPVTLGTSATRPWYVDATRLGSLYARLAEDRRSVVLYRIDKAVEGLEAPVKAAELMKL